MFKLKLIIPCTLLLFLFSCASDRQLVEFQALNIDLENAELHTGLPKEKLSPPNLPPVWRGRKLFNSPWAYIYAKNRKSAEYAYDQLEDIAEEEAGSHGLVIVSGSDDTEPAFEYEHLIKIYDDILKSRNLHEAEKPVFENELSQLKKVEEFHRKIVKKADEKKDENSLNEFRSSIRNIFSLATFFIQPEIMEKVLESQIDERVYWCAFIAVDDTIDENLDNIVTALMDDYDVSSFGRGIIWGIISPGFYFRKRKVINKTQEFFEEGYRKNAISKKGVVTFSDKAIVDQLPATVNGSE